MTIRATCCLVERKDADESEEAGESAETRILNQYRYDAFGNTVSSEEKVHNRFRYQGEQYDPLTGQYYLRARYYNPVIARFTQEDTYYGDGLNLYQYCANNPVMYQDPSGHNICSTQRDLYKKYKAECIANGMDEATAKATAYHQMRTELGISVKSGYNASGVGKGKDPWRSYKGGKTTVDVDLKYKEGWTPAQKSEADAKVKALTEANTVKTPTTRSGTSASSRYKSAYGKKSVPQGYDVDHTIDLQLGGADDILNMNPLDLSVNRSLGVQIKNAIKYYDEGTVFDKFTIH